MIKTAAKIFIDPKFHFHPKHKEIYQKVQKASMDFPEIKVITVSAFYPKRGDKWELHDTTAIAGTNNIGGLIEFNLQSTPTYNSIYHEMYHILQGTRPTAQKSQDKYELEATLLGQARLRKDRVETGYMAYYTTVPKSKVIEYAKLARTEKDKGNKNYMDVVNKRVHADYLKDVSANKNNAKNWKPDEGNQEKHSVKFIEKIKGKNYAKGYTPSEIDKYLKSNIKKDQQLVSNMFDPKTGGGYAYEKTDLIKVPDWMKNQPKKVLKPTSRKPKATPKSVIKTAQKHMIKPIRKPTSKRKTSTKK